MMMMKKLWAPQIDGESKRAYLYLPKHIHKLLTVRRDLIVFWEQEEKHRKEKKKSYTKWAHLQTTLTFCPFSSSSQLLCCFRSSNHTNNPNPTFSLLLQKTVPKTWSPPFCQVKNLKISQSLMLSQSLTHSLTHVLTYKCFLMSHTSSARWCFLWNKAKDSDLMGSFHHYCQNCQQLTTPARKDNRKKKKRRSSTHTHTHTHTHKERWFLIQRILHKNSVFFSNNNKMPHSNPEILHRNSSLWQLGFELIPWLINLGLSNWLGLGSSMSEWMNEWWDHSEFLLLSLSLSFSKYCEVNQGRILVERENKWRAWWR